MVAINSSGANYSPKLAKYTEGFVFGRDSVNEDYARAVVERSCAAVVTLLQDVFAVAEKTAFRQASEQTATSDQNRAFRRLADIIRYRAVIEKSVVTAVACAYAEMINNGMASQDNPDKDNADQIDIRISALEKLRCERLDLMLLFDVDNIRDHATDRNRPLLFDLNAKLGLLFGSDAKHIVCSPLSPATLIGGFVAGLMCADTDILSKKLLLRTFEQEFLSKLSVLMNSVILRLEQENLVAKRPVGFEEKNAGPISRVLSNSLVVSLSDLQREIDIMYKTLSSHRHFDVSHHLYELSGEDSTDSMLDLLSDVRYYCNNMQTPVLRMATNKAETEVLAEARGVITLQINEAFSGKKMPAGVKDFLENLWPGREVIRVQGCNEMFAGQRGGVKPDGHERRDNVLGVFQVIKSAFMENGGGKRHPEISRLYHLVDLAHIFPVGGIAQNRPIS